MTRVLALVLLSACGHDRIGPLPVDRDPDADADADADTDTDTDADADSATDTGTAPEGLLASADVEVVTGTCTRLHEVRGLAGDNLGRGIVVVDDRDGDGALDLAVTGRVGVRWMSRDGVTFENLGTGPDRDFVGSDPAGDVDGDGIGDLRITWSVPGGGGGPSTGNPDSTDIVSGVDGAEVLYNTGPALDDAIGLGDLDGDGGPELATARNGLLEIVDLGSGTVEGSSAPAEDRDGFSTLSVAELDGDLDPELVLGGWDVLRGIALDGTAVWTADGAAFGGPVAVVGDLDADGRDDVVAGDPTASPQGMAHAVSGATGTLGWSDTYLYGIPAVDVAGAGTRYGSAVVAAGDWTGDGVAEVVVAGDHGEPVFSGYGGALRVLDGASGAVLVDVRETAAAAAGSRFGSAIAVVPDEDGDGRSELVVGLVAAATVPGEPNGGAVVTLACMP